MLTDKNSIIKNTEAFIKSLLAHEGTGHDWWHVVRLRNSAKLMHETENGDWFVIELAIMLHDVGDRKVINMPDDDYTIAENFLHDQNVQPEIADQVMYIIKNMSFSKSLGQDKVEESIEYQIVQDADRLDAIGAIGIARAFAYGGSKARPLYDPTQETKRVSTTEEYKNLTSSTLQHFEEKLFLLKDLLNTKTAKEIADKRDKYMRQFRQQFLDEWDGVK